LQRGAEQIPLALLDCSSCSLCSSAYKLRGKDCSNRSSAVIVSKQPIEEIEEEKAEKILKDLISVLKVK
jgi:hypothetical protein